MTSTANHQIWQDVYKTFFKNKQIYVKFTLSISRNVAFDQLQGGMIMKKSPRNYPETMRSAESGRPMTRGEKQVSFKIAGKNYTYLQPGWWCSLIDPDDMEGQLVDEDNHIAQMARRTAKVLSHGEKVFVPVVIRAIRQRCGLTQREAGLLFGTGEKSFEKYESGETQPSAPTKRLLRFALERPELFLADDDKLSKSAPDGSFVHKALCAGQVDRFYEQLFATP
jgi:HTH-type transcriptional regulator/antitoxin MqsA